jgi:hypothetical protein
MMDRLNALYRKLSALELRPISIKEILCAAAGVKVARVSLADRERYALEDLLPSYGLKVTASEEKYSVARDVGKGGWANRFTGTVARDAPDGYWKLYIAPDAELARWARALDTRGDDDSFGKALGIPDCCRQFFDRCVKEAFAVQGDVLPFTARNTAGRYPYNFWNNSACQYFGYSLLSFFPCSFNCPASASVSRKTYALIEAVNRDFAQVFLDHHRRSVFYTEFSGVFLFIDSRYHGNMLTYQGVQGTTRDTDIARAVQQGDRLVLLERDSIAIQSGATVLELCEGDNFSLCVF